jgi:flagellar hook assembly protein FlgD
VLELTSKPAAPQEFALHQNHPNPFNPLTIISYQLPADGMVTLKIYTPLGQEIATLVDEVQSAGSKSVEWNAGNFPSGIYFYKLTAGKSTEVKKMVLAK